MLKFYFDENVSPAIAYGLHVRGVDVLTAREAGMLGASDEEQLLFALQNERVLFTQDTDFLRMHSRGDKHAGVVFCSQRKPAGEVISRLFLMHHLLQSQEMQNHVEFL